MSRFPGRDTRQVMRSGEEVLAHWLYTVIAVLCLLLLGRSLSAWSSSHE